jgi:hypothetical protein
MFESVLRENGSLLELIDSDWTFLNEELIGVYKLDRSKIDKKEISQHLVRVPLPEEYRNRAGLLGAGGVMTLAAYPQRTSAVLRGVWVLDKMPMLGSKRRESTQVPAQTSPWRHGLLSPWRSCCRRSTSRVPFHLGGPRPPTISKRWIRGVA